MGLFSGAAMTKVTDPSSPSALKEAHDRRESRVRSRSHIGSVKSAKAHQKYLDSLEPPSQEMVAQITAAQEQKEEEVMQKRLSQDAPNLSDAERQKAAGLIQRNYRGYRERRQLQGFGLDPSSRWMEAVKEARYRNLTQPRARISDDGDRAFSPQDPEEANRRRKSSSARQNWKKIGTIARRAGGDEDSDGMISEDGEDITEEERRRKEAKRAEEKAARRKAAKMMDLQYFLEMVDLKHRYGSNLRKYHQVWQKEDTNENFFYWLDYGEGRFIDTPGCPRSRLDREQVRYLSKEERLDYLVKIDDEGRLCYAKNGLRIDTTERFKDSIHGIVPDDDPTPAYAAARAEAATGLQDHSSTSSESSGSENEDDQEAARADKYANHDLDHSRGLKKVGHVSAATIFNKLLRASVKKNTWIFVADTSFRLYVGIKQSGSFQHSSFLHGSRISAAGLIKIKNGRLSKLSPLSGHYRPPVSNFRAFVHSLKDAGVDMSHVSISRSYAVLVGLEAYVKTRRKGKKMVKKLIHGRDKLLSPEELKKRELDEMDKSESAAREREYLEARKAEEAEKDVNTRLMRKLHLGSKEEVDSEAPQHKEIGLPGQGPENAIAPEGTRKMTE
jgi:hypothetical protein